jgi:hypothetical protein
MPEYLKAWRLFRANSDENQTTANFILGRSSWPRNTNLELCDLGCGDAHLLAEMLARTEQIQKVRLVDPDDDLLNEAQSVIEQRFPSRNIVALLHSVRDGWPKCAGDAHAILAVHLVYLLEGDELASLVHNRPKKAVTYIVLDAPTSVFTELWKWTADKYYRRAKLAHTELCNYLGVAAPPQDSRICSRIGKKLLTDHELSDWLLSILCYRNMLTDVPNNLRAEVDAIIERHTDETGEFVECESVCYELPAQA